MIYPDLLREVAKLAFRGVAGKRLRKKELAAELRKLGVLSEVIDEDDTRGVQEIVEEAGRFLLTRDAELSYFRSHHSASSQRGPLFEKYPALKNVTFVRHDQTTADRSLDNPFYTVQRLAASALEETFQIVSQPTLSKQLEAHVAISGGLTIFQTVGHLQALTAPAVYFYAGAVPWRGGIPSSHISPETNATIAWTRAGMLASHLYCTTLSPPDTVNTRNVPKAKLHRKGKDYLLGHAQTYSKDLDARWMLKQLTNFSMLVTSIDPVVPEYPKLYFANHDSLCPWTVPDGNASHLVRPYGVDPDLLAKEGAVGCMNYTFFDAEGHEHEDWKFCLTPGYPNTLDFYRETIADESYIVVVCTNPSVVPAIHAALKAGLFNWLITEQSIVEALFAFGA